MWGWSWIWTISDLTRIEYVVGTRGWWIRLSINGSLWVRCVRKTSQGDFWWTVGGASAPNCLMSCDWHLGNYPESTSAIFKTDHCYWFRDQLAAKQHILHSQFRQNCWATGRIFHQNFTTDLSRRWELRPRRTWCSWWWRFSHRFSPAVALVSWWSMPGRQDSGWKARKLCLGVMPSGRKLPSGYVKIAIENDHL